ncbi:uncharacterized protein LOC144091583 [Stigmatopora argus]
MVLRHHSSTQAGPQLGKQHRRRRKTWRRLNAGPCKANNPPPTRASRFSHRRSDGDKRPAIQAALFLRRRHAKGFSGVLEPVTMNSGPEVGYTLTHGQKKTTK